MFTGPPGSGKSELAWQLMQQGAELVADDQVLLSTRQDKVIAYCPAVIKNKLHLRSEGIITVNAIDMVIIEIIFQSTEPAFPLSQPPEINLPVVKLDFKAKNVIEIIAQHLRGLTA